MVDDCQTYAHIAYVLVEYFQIRDDEDRPLWMQIKSGDSNRRPGLDANNQICKLDRRTNPGDSDTDNSQIMHVIAPRPARPVRWPLFLRNLNPEHLSDPLLDEESLQQSSQVPMHRDELSLVDSAERKVLIETPKSQPDFLTAERITPTTHKYSIRTNKSRNHSVASTISPADVCPFHLTDLIDSPAPECDWI